jgi:hypothetical protein
MSVSSFQPPFLAPDPRPRGASALACFVLATALAASVSSAGCNKEGAGTRSPRRSDCDTEVTYDARNLSTRIDAGRHGAIGFHTGKQALREVDEGAERYLSRWMTLCKDYKNGAITADDYRDESRRIRAKMEELEELALRLERAPDDTAFQETLRQVHAIMVPADLRTDLGLEVQFMARRPGESAFSVTPQGATLATGAEVYLETRLTRPAHVYVYQIDAQERLSPLFPDPRIALTNPLPAGQALRLPPEPAKFTLNDQDLGIEHVHIVASAQPINALERGQLAQGSVNAETLGCTTRGLEFDAGQACPTTRGLVYDAGARDQSSEAYSVKGINAAADDTVHVVFSFHHVGQHEIYGVKDRGIEMMKTSTRPGPKQLEDDFDRCPGKAALKEMPAAGGAWEKWCVELNAGGVLVDHGPYRKWRSNGKLWVKGQHDLGRRTGRWTTFDANGRRVTEVDF